MSHALSGGGNVEKSPFSKAAALLTRGRTHVREHGKRARTPLAAFFNIPLMFTLVRQGMYA